MEVLFRRGAKILRLRFAALRMTSDGERCGFAEKWSAHWLALRGSSRTPTPTNETRRNRIRRGDSRIARFRWQSSDSGPPRASAPTKDIPHSTQGRISSARAECTDCITRPGRILSAHQSAVGATFGRPPCQTEIFSNSPWRGICNHIILRGRPQVAPTANRERCECADVWREF